MTAVGRGRSWVMASDQGALRRPGELPISVAPMATQSGNTSVEETLVSAVQALNLHEPAVSASTLRSFEEQLRKMCVSGDMLRNFVQRLHDRSLEDRQFGMKAAAACGVANTFEVEGMKLRNLLLAATQKDYEEYAQLQTSNAAKFLNSVALLGEIYHRVRLNDGSPIIVLATPVMHYLDILLSGEEHEMELFTTLLSVNGRKLLESSTKEMEELLLRVRNVLMSRNLSGQCRCWLLLALDLAANRFAPLPSALQGFYQVHLGSTALSQLQRIDAGLSVETGSSSHFSDTLLQIKPVEPPPVRSAHPPVARANSVPTKAQTTLPKISPPVLKESEGEIKGTTNNVEQPSKYNPEDASSRNWRENGAGKFKARSPAEKSGRKFSFTSNSNNMKDEPGSWRVGRESSADEKWGASKSQGWGHDDRFEKDESFYGRQEPRSGNKGSKPARTSNVGNKGHDPPTNKSKNDTSADLAVVPPALDEEENWD
ncbi:CBP80/20-dependent translation initiation factor [Anabrus simplex]|uniref:CBP80/20-dependent translation initiation factor n=1 Tax=Anabrus simplex TaxID=316456 RepID=UPI0034DCEAC4